MTPDGFAIYLKNFNNFRSKISLRDGLRLRRVAGARLHDGRARAGLFKIKRNLRENLTACVLDELFQALRKQLGVVELRRYFLKCRVDNFGV